jgi:hypothetical protein
VNLRGASFSIPEKSGFSQIVLKNILFCALSGELSELTELPKRIERYKTICLYTQSKVVFSKTLNLRLQKVPFSFGERDLGIEVQQKPIIFGL